MQYLKKTWIRILLSLIVGSVIVEIVAVSAADPNFRNTHRPASLSMLILAAVFYYLLTSYVKRKTRGY